MTETDSGANWWRPDRPAIRADVPGSPVAFGGLVAFTAILLLTPQTMVPVLKTLRIALLAAGVSILAHMLDTTIRRQPIVRSRREIVIAFALLIWAAITIPFSYWPSGSVALLSDQYLKAVIFFWLIATLVTTRQRLRTFAWALVLCSIPVAIIGLQHFRSGEFLYTGVTGVKRIAGYSGLSGNPNDLALTLNLIIPIAGALFALSRGAVARSLAAAALILGMATVIVTFSRAGFLTLSAIGVLSVVFFVKRRAPAAAAVIVIATMTVVPLLPAGYLERLNTITDIEADPTGSAQGRWADYQVAARLVAANPIVGAGIGQDILALDRVRGRATSRSVHNAYLEYAVDLGLPGLLLFLWLLVASFRSARRVEKRTSTEPSMRDLSVLASGVQIALVAFAVAAVFHPIAYQFYFFCVAGLAVALRNACVAELSAASPELAR
ncbi:MAG TPA: O-antigen ligase family protein [Vicinamibacterales bacterium]|nr:O-antigen ligase family protein [Vicinamibacterales bacterium]